MPTSDAPFPLARILVPVRLSAWLTGEIGSFAQQQLAGALQLKGAQVSRLPGGFLVEAATTHGELLEDVHHAVLCMEGALCMAQPFLHGLVGPAWTGCLPALFDAPAAIAAAATAAPLA